MRYRWPEGKQSAVILSFDFDAESGFYFREPEKAKRSLADRRSRGAPLRPPRRGGPYPPPHGPVEASRELFHSRLDGGEPPRPLPAHPRRRSRDRSPREHARGGGLPRRGPGGGGHGAAARHPARSPGGEADGIPVAVVGREHVDAGHPEAPRLPLRHLAHGQRRAVRDRQRGGAARGGAGAVAARRRAALPPRVRL